MPTTTPVKPADFAASDVLAPSFWTTRVDSQAPGIDVACTKIAVDLQNMARDSAESCVRQSLGSLREATGVDTVFVAMLDAAGSQIESVTVAKAGYSPCHLESLRGVALHELPWLSSRFEHLRLSEYRDTARPRKDQIADATRLTGLGVGAALLVAFHIQGRPAG
ncbi:MAG: hypothetical protein ABI859_16925, partial [Pseudomonadota bacterium]